MTGERMMWGSLHTSSPSLADARFIDRDRIEYEEWLLKALDASTAPKIPTRRKKEDKDRPVEDDHTVVSETVTLEHEKSC